MKQNKEFELNFLDITSIIWLKRRPLIIVSIITVILSSIFSGPFFIKPKFKSEVIFYPTTINSIGNATFTDLTQRQADPLAFGEEEEAENALQLLNSSALQGRIVRNFDLMNHYRIDSKSPLTDLANTLQLGNVMEGIHTIDVGMLVMPVLIEMMMLIGDSAGVDYDSGLEKKRRKDITRDTLVAKVSKELQKKLNEEKKDGSSKGISIEDISNEETMEEPEVEEVKPKGLMGRRT